MTSPTSLSVIWELVDELRKEQGLSPMSYVQKVDCAVLISVLETDISQTKEWKEHDEEECRRAKIAAFGLVYFMRYRLPEEFLEELKELEQVNPVIDRVAFTTKLLTLCDRSELVRVTSVFEDISDGSEILSTDLVAFILDAIHGVVANMETVNDLVVFARGTIFRVLCVKLREAMAETPGNRNFNDLELLVLLRRDVHVLNCLRDHIRNVDGDPALRVNPTKMLFASIMSWSHLDDLIAIDKSVAAMNLHKLFKIVVEATRSKEGPPSMLNWLPMTKAQASPDLDITFLWRATFTGYGVSRHSPDVEMNVVEQAGKLHDVLLTSLTATVFALDETTIKHQECILHLCQVLGLSLVQAMYDNEKTGLDTGTRHVLRELSHYVTQPEVLVEPIALVNLKRTAAAVDPRSSFIKVTPTAGLISEIAGLIREAGGLRRGCYLDGDTVRLGKEVLA